MGKAHSVHACALQMALSGESNTIKYSVEPQFFDCGLTPYDKPAERELFVVNTGKVCTTSPCGVPNRP